MTARAIPAGVLAWTLVFAAVSPCAGDGIRSVGPVITITTGGSLSNTVCYNPDDDVFLVLWQQYGGPHVVLRGRCIDADTGAFAGPEFQVAEWVGLGGVVYNQDLHCWFVVYFNDHDLGGDLFGQKVGINGNVGNPIPLVATASDQGASDIAYDPVRQRYLVAWTDYHGASPNIRGRLFNLNGNTIANMPELQISDYTLYSQVSPRVTYNPATAEFLVVWFDLRNDVNRTDPNENNNNYTDTYGQRIDAVTGALLGADIPVVVPPSVPGQPYVADGYDGPGGIACNTNPLSAGGMYGTHFLGIQKLTAPGWTTKAVILAANGSHYGEIFNVSHPLRGGYTGVVYNPYDDTYFVTYLDANYDLSGQQYSATGQAIRGAAKIIANPTFEENLGGLAVRPSDGLYMQSTVWFENLVTHERPWTLVAQRFIRDTTLPEPPGPPSAPHPGDTATGVATNAQLTWTAGSNTVSHDVYWGTTNPPPFRLNQTATTYDPGVLTMSTTYYWRANEVNTFGTTLGPIWTFTTAGPSTCLTDRFPYADGSLNGKGGWSGSAGAEISVAAQTVRISGGTTSVDVARSGLTCADPGTGLIPLSFKVHAGVGIDTVWSLWIDDTAGTNMVRWYGSGTSARGRVGSTTIVTDLQTLTGSWDDLLVMINSSAKTASFFFNGASIGMLDYSSQNAGNVIDRIRLERPDNTTTADDYLSFDDLVIGELVLPGQASDPSPANGATDVSNRPTLSWTAGANAASHDVYFGTTSPGTFRGNQSGTSFNPGVLFPNTTYYWRIDEKNVDGTTAGVVWSLTTNPADFDSDGDVDQSDFGHLQACLTEDGQPCSEACLDADLDGDGVVGGLDLDKFRSCMGGPNQPPGC